MPEPTATGENSGHGKLWVNGASDTYGGGGAEIGVRLTTNIIVGIAVMHKLLVHYYNEQHPSSMLPLVFIQFIKVNVIYTHDASICPEPAESPPGYTSKGRGF